MIYDCFLFFNELDLLEIRLNELYDSVDKFVIVEADTTFSGLKKPYNFLNHQKRFSEFAKKIIYIPLRMPKKVTLDNKDPLYNQVSSKNRSVWAREVYQRNSILKGLSRAKSNDLILIGDIDEIPNKNRLLEIKHVSKDNYAFKQSMFYFYLNCQADQEWVGTKAIYKKFLDTPQKLRSSPATKTINDGGWHFSYLGGVEKIREKINSYSHQELNSAEYNELNRIMFNIENNLDIFNRNIQIETIPISDKSHPQHIYLNQKRYSALIKSSQEIDKNIKLLRKEVNDDRIKITQLKNYNSEIQKKLLEAEATNNFLHSQLNTIQSSKTYILWQKFNDLKKRFR